MTTRTFTLPTFLALALAGLACSGEPHEGETTDVAVGRIPAWNTSALSTLLGKILCVCSIHTAWG
jgi:hypothetical protein